MRVLWISERFPPQKGGVAAAAARQAAAAAEKLERVDLLCPTADLPPGQVRAEERGRLVVHRLGRAAKDDESWQLVYEAAVALGRRGDHALVHGFYAVPAGYAAVLAARSLGVPSSVSLRGNDLDRALFSGARAPLLFWTLEQADALLGVSRAILERARSLTGRAEGLHWAPNGVDGGFYCPGEPEPAALLPYARLPRPWLGFSGELRLKKGLPVLLALAEDLARRGTGTLFAVGGARAEEGPELERWRRREPAAAARFVEVPYQRDPAALRDWYRALDLVVFPSLWDGLPNALLEAMACGRPVLASRAGGIPDAVEDGRSGVLVPVDRLDRFPQEAARVLGWPKERLKALGRGARERALARFTPRKERNALLRVWRALAAGARAEALAA